MVVSHDQPLYTHSIEHTVPWHRMAPCPHIRGSDSEPGPCEANSGKDVSSKVVPPHGKSFQNDRSVCSAHKVDAVPFEAICEEYFTKVAPYLQSFVPARMQQNVLQGPSLANLLQTPETQSLNLTVLRRIDSAITQVLRPSQVCETTRVAGDSIVSQVSYTTLHYAKPNSIIL